MSKHINFIITTLLILSGMASLNVTKKRLLANRIVGGRPALIQDYPKTVSVQSYNSHICGGSIF